MLFSFRRRTGAEKGIQMTRNLETLGPAGHPGHHEQNGTSNFARGAIYSYERQRRNSKKLLDSISFKTDQKFYPFVHRLLRLSPSIMSEYRQGKKLKEEQRAGQELSEDSEERGL
jgi:hypothetical protein